MNKILLKKRRYEQNRNFIHYSSIKTTTKIIIPIVVVLCISFIIFSFFLKFKYKGSLYIMTIKELSDIRFLENRLFRPLGYLIAGLSIPIVAAALQSTTRNKLAEPTTLGFFPVILMSSIVGTLLGGNLYIKWLLACSFSLLLITFNLLISKKDVAKSSLKTVLIGFTLNGVFTSINWILVEYSGITGINPLSWLSGTSIVPLTENNIIVSTVVMVVFTIGILIMIPYYNIIQKDPILAKSLGINVEAIFWITATFSVFIVVSSSFAAGGVTLLGLVIPHLIRIMFKTNDNKVVMLLSPIFGATLLLISNIIRNGYSININMLTAILALPIFLTIVIKKEKHGIN